MRYFALTNYLAASLATSPADSLHSLHSSQGTARVQKLRSAVMRAPIVESSMSTPSPVSTSTSTDEPSTRRRALQSILVGGSVAFMGPVGARALDMDAFMNSQLEADTKNCDPKRDPKCIPVLNSDEALCKYGQSGTARGEACKRVKAAGGTLAKPGSLGKSQGLGGASGVNGN